MMRRSTAVLTTLLAMLVALAAVLLLGRIGPALGWPMPATLGLPAIVFLTLGVVTARRVSAKERRRG